MNNPHSERAHSRIGASGWSRWSNCPGSVWLERGIPDKTSPFAEEGTRAHEFAEYCLLNGIVDANGRDAKEHVHWTEEVGDAVQVYLDAVWAARTPGTELEVETRFHLSQIDDDAFGTNDAMVYDMDARKLTIFDYKHGAGVPVEVEKNGQLLYYALGATTGKHNRPLRTVEMVIVQPRCPHPDGPVRRWEIDALELADWAADLKAAIDATKDPNAPRVAGSWCRWCKAAAICDANRQSVVDAAREDFMTPEEMPEADIAALLHDADRIEAWVRQVRQHAYEAAMAGKPVTGFKLVAKRAQRKWGDETSAVAFAKGCGLGVEDIYDRKVKSVAQLEKLLPKGDRDALDAYVVKESSGLALVPERDRREAVTPDAISDFA